MKEKREINKIKYKNKRAFIKKDNLKKEFNNIINNSNDGEIKKARR